MRALFLIAALLLPFQSRPADTPTGESILYRVEWRLITAGSARLGWKDTGSGYQARLQLQSAGLISMLFPVNDLYTAEMNRNLCVASTFLSAHEGLRSRETTVTYDGGRRKASYAERDLRRNATVGAFQTEIPACTQEITGALYRLRGMRLAVGKSVEIPLSDGKKSVMARVEAQQQETVETPAGKFQTIRYEAFLFNDILYHRNGHLYVWLTDDDRRLPVQIRARLEFHVGAITLQLVKAEGM
jgi:hypothetical protein